jgi:hypothetical protein
VQHADQALLLVEYWLAAEFSPKSEPCVRGTQVWREVLWVVEIWLDLLTIRYWGFCIVQVNCRHWGFIFYLILISNIRIILFWNIYDFILCLFKSLEKLFEGHRGFWILFLIYVHNKFVISRLRVVLFKTLNLFRLYELVSKNISKVCLIPQILSWPMRTPVHDIQGCVLGQKVPVEFSCA